MFLYVIQSNHTRRDNVFDLLIKNGIVVDGTGNPWTKVDVAVQNGKIVRMNKNINEEASKIVDASNKVVSPGFIDTHIHSDLMCTIPTNHQIRLKQGVTTELIGQDGISVAPISEYTKSFWQDQLKSLIGDIGDWNWFSVSEYLRFLNTSNLLGNVAYLVPHGNVRTLVMGFEERTATKTEMIQMRKIVEKSIKEGAIGFSTGLVYPPNVFSNTEELIEICKGVAKYDGCFVVHIRNESFSIIEAFDEMLEVARKTGVRLHISHFKVIGSKNRHYYPQILKKMQEARSEGIEITFDQYPYTAGSSILHSILPPWVHDGGTEKMLTRLKDKTVREQIAVELEESTEFENWVYNVGWESIIISSVNTRKNKYCEGKNMIEISEIRNQSPTEAMCDLLIEEHGNVLMIDHWGREEDIIKAMKSPYHIVGSDGIFGNNPHPRLYGTHPRILARYVRELGVLTLEEAIHHMTGAPAQLMRLKDRGLLKEGYWADIIVFDPNKVQDNGTYEVPKQEPTGIETVIVNGKVTISNGNATDNGIGKVLSNSQFEKYL